jgi:isopenicillin-N N-acyltransferase like protein
MTMIPQRVISLFLAVWCGVCTHLLAADAASGRTADGGQWAERDGVKILSLVGDATALGRQAGELIGPQTKGMLGKLVLVLPGLPPVAPADADGHGIDPEYRDEINAWATAAKIDPTVLMQANLAVGALCTAVVREPDADQQRPLLLARNMDFRPASELGPRTVVIVRRPTGKHASMAVSWPGYVGVVSGMNDAGVSACLLLNHGAKRTPTGEYLGFRLRAILDQAEDLPSALALFAAKPTASSNYVMLADATSSALVWWQDGKLQQVTPSDGWQFCTNAKLADDTRQPLDARGRRAVELSRLRRNPDIEWMKHLLTATYMPLINAQAMIFVPATRTLHLATHDAKAAALSPWHVLDGTVLMSGADLTVVPVVASPAIADPFPHYAGAH